MDYLLYLFLFIFFYWAIENLPSFPFIFLFFI